MQSRQSSTLHLWCCGRMPAESSGRGITVRTVYHAPCGFAGAAARRRLGRIWHLRAAVTSQVTMVVPVGAGAGRRTRREPWAWQRGRLRCRAKALIVQHSAIFATGLGLLGSNTPGLGQSGSRRKSECFCASDYPGLPSSPRPLSLPSPWRWRRQTMSLSDAARCKPSSLSGAPCTLRQAA